MPINNPHYRPVGQGATTYTYGAVHGAGRWWIINACKIVGYDRTIHSGYFLPESECCALRSPQTWEDLVELLQEGGFNHSRFVSWINFQACWIDSTIERCRIAAKTYDAVFNLRAGDQIWVRNVVNPTYALLLTVYRIYPRRDGICLTLVPCQLRETTAVVYDGCMSRLSEQFVIYEEPEGRYSFNDAWKEYIDDSWSEAKPFNENVFCGLCAKGIVSLYEHHQGIPCIRCRSTMTRCPKCRDWCIGEKINIVRGRQLCSSCAALGTFICYSCEKRYTIFDRFLVRTDAGGTLYYCRNCIKSSRYTEVCVSCGLNMKPKLTTTMVSPQVYCSKCPRPAIRDYGYKPIPRFYTINKMASAEDIYYGVELEVEDNVDRDVNSDARALARLTDGYIYMKHDGCIGYGFEIVSHPATYEWLIKNYRMWLLIMEFLGNNHFYSSAHCGMHIHMSRTAFELAPSWLNRLQSFIYGYPKFIIHLSNRQSQEGLHSFARLNLQPSLIRQAIIRKQREGSLEGGNITNDRYEALNLCNKHTIELRIFESTIDSEVFLRNLQATDSINLYTRKCKIGKPSDYLMWMKTNGQYTALAEWLEDTWCDKFDTPSQTKKGELAGCV